jgi:hypothetical protein
VLDPDYGGGDTLAIWRPQGKTSRIKALTKRLGRAHLTYAPNTGTPIATG